MSSNRGTNLALLGRTFRRVFSFFFFLGRRSRKTKVFYVMSGLPVAMAAVIKINQMTAGTGRDVVNSVFVDILMMFYLQFLIIILALFYGTSICSEEIEGRTLHYLTTRPLMKSGIILGKYGAYSLLLSLMVLPSLFCSYFVLNAGRLDRAAVYLAFLRYAGVMVLGILGYLAFFAFLGTALRRPILIGLAFGFGWETVLQYFPGSTQRFSVVHYLKSLLPRYSPGRFSLLTFRLEPTDPLISVIMVLLISAAFIGLACLAFSLKEYISAD